jgi:glycine hydroxymethyltransferase
MKGDSLYRTDPEVFGAIWGETDRQHSKLELIASENFCSEAVLDALGSVLTNKYGEGYPYGWDKETGRLDYNLFGCDHANVQAHSGTTANMSAYFALADPGDVIFGLNLSHGGHLSHGHPINFSGRFFKVIQYGVDEKTEQIDFSVLRKLALEHRPKIIVSGASAYPRTLHFDRFQEICDEVGAHQVADIAHIAGLVATGLHPSPIPYADVVTTTTHKTLRGPRGAMIMCKQRYAQAIDKCNFPGMQGGPLEHVISAKAVCLK